MNRPIVFVLTPFSEEHIALYEMLKEELKDNFAFSNAGDLDNSRNIISDIVYGINEASVIIADLTGLNPNVFYELGLAHALRKKTIIITQDIDELPFDIRSYRAVEYGMQFNRIPALIDELRKLLSGAMDGSIQFGNPVTDFITKRDVVDNRNCTNGEISILLESSDTGTEEIEQNEEMGLVDHLSEIEEQSIVINSEIESLGKELEHLIEEVEISTADVNKISMNKGSGNVIYLRNICRKLAIPIDDFSKRLQGHVSVIGLTWEKIDNSYLSLLDSPHIHTTTDTEGLNTSINSLEGLKNSVIDTDEMILSFKMSVDTIKGMEKRLNKAANNLSNGLDTYLSMTSAMVSSVERIIKRSQMLMEEMRDI